MGYPKRAHADRCNFHCPCLCAAWTHVRDNSPPQRAWEPARLGDSPYVRAWAIFSFPLFRPRPARAAIPPEGQIPGTYTGERTRTRAWAIFSFPLFRPPPARAAIPPRGGKSPEVHRGAHAHAHTRMRNIQFPVFWPSLTHVGQYAALLFSSKACPSGQNLPARSTLTRAAHALDKSFSSASRSGLATGLGPFKDCRNRQVIL